VNHSVRAIGLRAGPLLALVAVVAVVAVFFGYSRRNSAPTGASETTPGPAAEDLASRTVAQEEKSVPSTAGSDVADKGNSARPLKQTDSGEAKLSDQQFIELMVDLAAVTSRLADKTLSQDQFLPEVEKVCKRYGLTLDELDAEQAAHKLSSEQNAEFTRMLKERLGLEKKPDKK